MSTFLTKHLTIEAFTRKDTSSVLAKVNSLYWTEWKLQALMQGLGLVQLAPCLQFSHKRYSLPLFAFCPTWSRDVEGEWHRGCDHLHTGSWSKKHIKPGAWATFAKATAAQNPLYSAQILACRCMKSCAKYVTVFLKELLVSKGSFSWTGISEGRSTCSSFIRDRR